MHYTSLIYFHNSLIYNNQNIQEIVVKRQYTSKHDVFSLKKLLKQIFTNEFSFQVTDLVCFCRLSNSLRRSKNQPKQCAALYEPICRYERRIWR